MLYRSTCDLFIRSYWKDLEWLSYCLASIQKYCREFRSVIVVLPQSSAAWLRRMDLSAGSSSTDIRFAFCRDYPDDYLGQQATKMLADTFTDADYICHVDSDCVFRRLTTPNHLIDQDRPRVMKRSRDELGRHYPWREPTERFLGWTVRDDFMQQPPFTFPRWLYSGLREHAVLTHGVDMERYIEAQSERGFSEFNVLGAFAWQRHRERFIWVDIGSFPPIEPHCHWYWSWGGINDVIRSEILETLGVGQAGRLR